MWEHHKPQTHKQSPPRRMEFAHAKPFCEAGKQHANGHTINSFLCRVMLFRMQLFLSPSLANWKKCGFSPSYLAIKCCAACRSKSPSAPVMMENSVIERREIEESNDVTAIKLRRYNDRRWTVMGDHRRGLRRAGRYLKSRYLENRLRTASKEWDGGRRRWSPVVVVRGCLKLER
jgi:hypothetical protein